MSSPDPSTAVLRVNGTDHTGWTDISVTRALEQFASSFDIGFTWTDVGQLMPKGSIREGDECFLFLDDRVVISGYVDSSEINEDGEDRNMTVSGRSYTGDLVDCSSVYKAGRWKNQSVLAIANDLCQPFNISVSADPGVFAVVNAPLSSSTFSIQDGETVYETLERACRMIGVLLTTDIRGNLRFTSVSAVRTQTVIEYGVNAVAHGRSGSWKDRFSQVTVKVQSPGTSFSSGQTTNQQKYSVVDTDIVVPAGGTRHRPLIIQAEQHMGSAQKLQARATWERNVRAGRATKLRYTMDSWSNAEGLWVPNVLARVKDTLLQVDTTLLVTSVHQYISEEGGSNTDLELIDPRALTVEPLTKQPKGKNKTKTFSAGSPP